MGVKNFVKSTFKANTNVKGWSSWEQIKENGKTVNNFFNDLKAPKPAAKTTQLTFEQMVQQQKLTEKDLQTLKQSHLRVAICCALLGLGALGWMIYLLSKAMFLSSIVALSLSALMFAYAFREHFGYFQIKQKRLNCSVKEWFSSFFSKKK